MSNPQPRRLNSLFGKRNSKERRPAGISRRQKRQFGFETLEDRRVMANGMQVWDGTFQFQNYSSNTASGAAAIAADELYWQSLMANASPRGEVTTNSIPTDPMLANQWHLINTGQAVGTPDWQPIYGVPGMDINVAPVWVKGYTGAGVVIAVIDTGVQTNHPDLAANISTTIPGYNVAQSGSNANPTPNQQGGAHGTAVAGIIAAVANNGIGGTGIAPGASIVPIRLLAPTQNQNATVDAFRYRIQDIDITNNSWGSATPRALAPLSVAEVQALRDSIVFGRGGLGVIHVFSSGNSGASNFFPGFGGNDGADSSIYDGWKNSRYTITVGGFDHDGEYLNEDGTITSYPEAGANVLIVAPTGSNGNFPYIGDDEGIGSGIWTTDLTGTRASGLGGMNVPPHPTQGEIYDRDFYPDADYTSRMNGTSASAPMVSGVIALMLEANPNLTWRDVQEILVRSAKQISPLENPTDGSGNSTQNTWFVNQQPLFQDPDIYDPDIDVPGFIRTRYPTLDPAMNQPLKMANGAGYTVSQGLAPYGEQFGYAHGAIDAEMAVLLAEQWHEKGQQLKAERTYTSGVNSPGSNTWFAVQPAIKTNLASGLQVVPGGFSTVGIGSAYWEEYFKTGDEPPFSQDDPPRNTRGQSYIEFSVPDNNRMSVETVEVRVNITGGTAEALEHMRLVLVSPTGTHSELNHYIYGMGTGSYQTSIPGMYVGSFGSVDNGGNLVWSFTTNRNWGELSDDAPIIDPDPNSPTFGEPLPLMDPDTGEPVVDDQGNIVYAGTKGWRLYVENYSPTAFGLAVSLNWHGQAVAASSQRVQGSVGIDDNADGEFNFSRVITNRFEIDDDPDTLRFRELFTIADPFQERFAANATVLAKRADGSIAAQFVTGADGNYYFDLPPGVYDISVVDSLGRSAIVDTINVTNNEHVKNVNFLLDAGITASPEAVVEGNVLADLNGDGINNGEDVPGAGVTVYVDVNRNGVFDGSDVSTVTDAAGNYQIVVPNVTANFIIDVRVQLPPNWTAVAPLTGMTTVLIKPGVTSLGVNFAIKPPANGGPGGPVDPATPGTLIGLVYEDSNASGTRDSGEQTMPNVTVYIDANNNGVLDAGEISAITSSQGSYVFSVPAGQHRIRAVVVSPNVQTSPGSNSARVVNVAAGGTISGIAFGLRNSADYDYGDLPIEYGMTTYAQNGARHRKGVTFLGSRIDGEVDGQAGANADGDDIGGYNDDDGVVFDPIVVGSTVRLVVTASRNTGYLKGWIDWNDNKIFDENERLVFSGVGATSNNVLLASGPNVLYITVPAGVTATHVYARFRYGEATIDSPWGAALTGEVEDYRLAVGQAPLPAIVGIPSDFNGDGRVDGNDFLVWQRNYGKTTGATQGQGDATRDGAVNHFDLNAWKNEFGIVTEEEEGDPEAAASVSQAMTASLLEEGMTAEALEFSTEVPAPVEQASFVFDTASVLPSPAAERIASRATTQAFDKLAGILTDVADRLQLRAANLEERIEERRDFVADLLTDVADRFEDFDFATVRRDRAFDDLFGSRRRQGLRAEVEAGTDGELDADEAFAMFADHLERPRG